MICAACSAPARTRVDDGTTVPIDLDVDGDVNLEVDLDVDVDSDRRAAQPGHARRRRTSIVDAVLDTAIDAGADGVVLTTAQRPSSTPTRVAIGWLAGATAAARICGVQVAIAASSTSAPCAEPAVTSGGEG